MNSVQLICEEKTIKPEEKKVPGEKEIETEELEEVSGSGALEKVPVVDEHDYDEDIRKKVGGN